MDSKKLGLFGELYAGEILKRKKFSLLAQNYHAQGGELDIIAYDLLEKIHILVEVKTRKNQDFMYGIESVNRKKIQRMKRAFTRYSLIEKKWKEVPEYEIHAVILILKKNMKFENTLKLKNILNLSLEEIKEKDFGDFEDFENIFDLEYYDDLF